MQLLILDGIEEKNIMSTKNPYEGAVITTKPQSAAYPTQQAQMTSNSSMNIKKKGIKKKKINTNNK